MYLANVIVTFSIYYTVYHLFNLFKNYRIPHNPAHISSRYHSICSIQTQFSLGWPFGHLLAPTCLWQILRHSNRPQTRTRSHRTSRSTLRSRRTDPTTHAKAIISSWVLPKELSLLPGLQEARRILRLKDPSLMVEVVVRRLYLSTVASASKLLSRLLAIAQPPAAGIFPLLYHPVFRPTRLHYLLGLGSVGMGRERCT